MGFNEKILKFLNNSLCWMHPMSFIAKVHAKYFITLHIDRVMTMFFKQSHYFQAIESRLTKSLITSKVLAIIASKT
jgi:hypothetical protein